jgi:23S rRNA (adenine2030-N6)-methyltransferase
MLSYQHGFHAGNVADVLKHAVLCQTVDYLLQKDKPFYFHDTHAGRGLYDLTHPVAQKTGDYRDGIARIWNQPGCPVALLPYMRALQGFNSGTGLRMYAGSSLLAQRMMRDTDRVMATELHPQEFQALQDNAALLRNMRVSKEDGFAALKAALPPRERRGVVLMDPSYELPADDMAVVSALQEALKRFATGIYLVWYPVVEPARTRKLVKNVSALPVQQLLQLEFYTREPDAASVAGRGMSGSGMLVINPPWQLDAAMREALPWLVKQLAPDTGSAVVEWLVN